jgi:hypothetical protein
MPDYLTYSRLGVIHTTVTSIEIGSLLMLEVLDGCIDDFSHAYDRFIFQSPPD